MNTTAEARIEADPTVPMIHIYREFKATAAQLLRAHTDPELFVRWIGPDGTNTPRIDHWDARTGGSWRWTASHDGVEYSFRGCFHEVSDSKIVQTFTFEGMPDGVCLETLTFTDLGNGRTQLHVTSLCESFEAREGWLNSGMEVGVNDGYAKLDALLGQGVL